MRMTAKILVGLGTILLLLLHTPVYAHITSQEGVLAKSYHEKYGDYYIGGEAVGWSIDEKFHTNGTSITYSFSSTDPYLTDTYKSYVTAGAAKWSGTVIFTNKTDGTGLGTIRTYNAANSGVVARFTDYETLSHGHLFTWVIEMNRAYTQSSTILAHELGHVIGLNDLYESRNQNKLMYGYSNTSASSPTSLDIWGAKVITGVHSSHIWGYKYYDTNSTGNRHVNYCTQCNGLGLNVTQCIYNTNNVCKTCGTPKGAQPYSLEKIILLK